MRLRDLIDWNEALERMDGDVALLQQLLRIFRADAPGMLVRLMAAAHAGEPRELERAAHALKGASATISARAITEPARAIEQLAREERVAEARTRVAELEPAFLRLMHALDEAQQRDAA
jgi:HPt (histidine-containing phosphotransfer) domain-containing protein